MKKRWTGKYLWSDRKWAVVINVWWHRETLRNLPTICFLALHSMWQSFHFWPFYFLFHQNVLSGNRDTIHIWEQHEVSKSMSEKFNFKHSISAKCSTTLTWFSCAPSQILQLSIFNFISKHLKLNFNNILYSPSRHFVYICMYLQEHKMHISTRGWPLGRSQ